MVRYTFLKRSHSQYNGDNIREVKKRKQQKIVLGMFVLQYYKREIMKLYHCYD